MSVYKSRGAWVFSIRVHDPVQNKERRIQRRPETQTEHGARMAELLTLQKIEDGSFWKEEYPDHYGLGPEQTFQEYCEQEFFPNYCKVKLATSTYGDYVNGLKNHVWPIIGKTQLSSIGAREIAAIDGRMVKNDLAPKSRANLLGYLQRALNVAKEWEYIDKVPNIERPKLSKEHPDWLTHDEAKALVKHAESTLIKHFVILGLNTGMRFGEMSALRWEDVDFDRKVVQVRKNFVQGELKKPKSGHQRTIPMTQTLYDHLQKHSEDHTGVFIAETDDQKPFTLDMLKRAMKRSYKAAKIGGGKSGWHILRHTYASWLVQKNVPILKVSTLLGHSDVRITMKYAHLAPNTLHDDVSVLDPIQG